MTEFGVWAPERNRIRLRLGSGSGSGSASGSDSADIVAMSRSDDGWWRVDVPATAANPNTMF